MGWTKQGRIRAVVRGELPDRPPISAWRHFPGMEETPEDLAKAMIDFQDAYDWDFMKINPRAVYYHEVWGNRYDYSRYNDVVPSLVSCSVHEAEDLEGITVQSGDAPPLEQQTEAVRLIKRKYGESLPVFQTVFTPIGILLNLCGQRSLGRYRESRRDESLLIRLLNDSAPAVHRALDGIARTLVLYIENLIDAGIDGIFFAALGMAREGYLTEGEWKEFAMPYDLAVLKPLKEKKEKIVMLHTCGIDSNPARFANYPIDILHWAESAPGNPPIAGSESWLGKIAPMGGVDERLFGAGKEEEIARRVKDSLRKNERKPFVLAPECSVSIKTSDSELRAFRDAVEP